MPTFDFRRGEVFAAYMSACKSEGVDHDPVVHANLLLWGCHRDDWYDDPVAPAPDAEAAARKRVVRATIQAARVRDETVPPVIVAAMTKWAEREVRP